MNFVILRNEGTMAIDNATLDVDTSPWIGAHVEIVAWHGEVGYGMIEYNHVPRVTYRIYDLENYQAPIDRWMTVASSQLSPPLVLQQAQNIKLDMVDALYQNKRIRPLVYAGWEWDRSDEAIAHMTSMVAGVGLYDRIDQVVTETQSAFGTMKSSIDANVRDVFNATAASIAQPSANMAYNWGQLHMSYSGAVETGSLAWLTSHGHALTIGLTGNLFQYFPHVAAPNTGTGTFGYMNGISSGSVVAGGNTDVWWQPLNAQSLQPINANTFRDALRYLVNVRTAQESQRAVRKNHIRGLASIPAVIAYDVAGGW